MGATETSGAAVRALHDAGMHGLVYIEAFGPAPAQVDDSVADVVQRMSRVSEYAGDRVRVGISPHAPYTVSDALFRAVAEIARAEALPVAVHAAEAEAEDLLIREGAARSRLRCGHAALTHRRALVRASNCCRRPVSWIAGRCLSIA